MIHVVVEMETNGNETKMKAFSFHFYSRLKFRIAITLQTLASWMVFSWEIQNNISEI